MRRVVIGLENDGYQLRNDIYGYIQGTGQPNDIEHVYGIYNELVSQVVHALEPQFKDYLLNLQSVPVYQTINYTENAISRETAMEFGSQVHSFAIRLWNYVYSKVEHADSSHFVLEAATLGYIVLAAHPLETGPLLLGYQSPDAVGRST